MNAVATQGAAHLREMRERDLARVVEIERRAYEFPWSSGIFADCLRVGYLCRVLELAGRIEAYGIMVVALDEAHILNLCVETLWQGHGLGRALLRALLELARSRGARTAVLEVRPSNGRALRLYEHLGFSEVGVRKGYYPARSGREDALLLAVDLECWRS